jgi:hypothetical protein
MAKTNRGMMLAALEGAPNFVPENELRGLADRLEGRLLWPEDAGWHRAVHIWNASVTKVPALVAQPRSGRDVSTLVDFARARGVLSSVKGGGHGIAGTCIAEDGLMLDMSQMRDVAVMPDSNLARVGPGCLLCDVDRATQEHGLATTLGFISDTGVAGLTLGGGFGYLMRRFGWAADNLEEVEVVTADGEVRVANRRQHADLLWALRGGGGNFGIVTRMTFRLHEVGPMVTGGLIAWSIEHVDEVLDTYRKLTERAPRELTTALMMRLAPPEPFVPESAHLEPIIGMIVCHSGANPSADLAPLRALPAPIFDLIDEHPYTVQQSMLDNTDPDGLNQYWKTEYFPRLSPELLSAWRDGAMKVASPLSYSVIFHIGGVNNERAEDDGAVGNRDARFIGGFSGVWPPGNNGSAIVTGVRDAWRGILPFSTGGNYVNFQLADDTPERTAAAYRGNLERLRQIKATYDPENLFRTNRNISPAQADANAPKRPSAR